MAEKTKKHRSWMYHAKRRGDLTYDLVNFIIVIVLTLLFFYPLYLVVISAFSSPDMVFGGKVLLWPKGNNMDGFKEVLKTSSLWTGYGNTIIITIVGVIINLFVTFTGAYALSKKTFALRKPISFMVIFTMFFSGGMIPSFLLVKGLGLINTIWSLILPGACSTWNLMVARTFLQASIPDELHDAALIDGCNNTRFLVSVVLPLSTTLIAVLGLFYGVGHWNNYWNAMLYITDVKKYPLQLVLRNILLQAKVAMQEAKTTGMVENTTVVELYYRSESMKYIVVVASILPMAIIFPFVEKYFVKGVMIGSIKG